MPERPFHQVERCRDLALAECDDTGEMQRIALVRDAWAEEHRSGAEAISILSGFVGIFTTIPAAIGLFNANFGVGNALLQP